MSHLVMGFWAIGFLSLGGILLVVELIASGLSKIKMKQLAFAALLFGASTVFAHLASMGKVEQFMGSVLTLACTFWCVEGLHKQRVARPRTEV